jgi:hypothetical protein
MLGTFKFVHDGKRLRPDQTPGEVRELYALYCMFPTRFLQLEMEDGDQIDAFLEQVSSHILELLCNSNSLPISWVVANTSYNHYMSAHSI